MPWSETSAMEQRVQFIRDWLTHKHCVSELCTSYGVSRKTGYKWIERYMTQGPDGLLDRGHAAQVVHNKTSAQAEQALLALRLRHPSWGAKKLLHTLSLREPMLELPGRSTVCDILSRNGLVRKKPRRRALGHPGRPSSSIVLPNDCWSADFKGHFRTGDGLYCYPLTVTDNYSRYLLGCQALAGTSHDASKAVFTRLFKHYGLPRRIRTDNGVPFAAASLARLSRLSVWWLKLGVLPELIEPGQPQQNGRHERMHRTLKDETTKPPAASSRAQQRKFDAFVHEYNEERPHEALDMSTPAQLYEASPRAMPDKLLPPEYPDRFEVRYVSANGGIRWRKRWVNVTSALIGEYVGLEEIDDGHWDVFFGPLKLGRLHERSMRIEDHLGRLKRRVPRGVAP
jgi:putative transposase